MIYLAAAAIVLETPIPTIVLVGTMTPIGHLMRILCPWHANQYQPLYIEEDSTRRGVNLTIVVVILLSHQEQFIDFLRDRNSFQGIVTFTPIIVPTMTGRGQGQGQDQGQGQEAPFREHLRALQ